MGTTTAILLAMSVMVAPFTQSFATASVDTQASAKAELHPNWEQGLPKGIWNRLENGKVLPKGWVKKIAEREDDEDEQVDVTAPVMSNIQVQAGVQSVILTLSTNEEARVEVRYDTDEPDEQSLSMTSLLGTQHHIKLMDLESETEYVLSIRATDKAGNISASQRLVVMTKLSADSDAPEIQFETVFGISSTSARIFWLTNEPSNTHLWLSTSSTIDTTRPAMIVKEEMTFFHKVGLQDLHPNTTYYYVIASADSSGNQTVLTANSFTTLE